MYYLVKKQMINKNSQTGKSHVILPCSITVLPSRCHPLSNFLHVSHEFSLENVEIILASIMNISQLYLFKLLYLFCYIWHFLNLIRKFSFLAGLGKLDQTVFRKTSNELNFWDVLNMDKWIGHF